MQPEQYLVTLTELIECHIHLLTQQNLSSRLRKFFAHYLFSKSLNLHTACVPDGIRRCGRAGRRVCT